MTVRSIGHDRVKESYMERIRLGLVGCGSLALRGVLPHLVLDDAKQKAELVGVADVAEDRAKAAAEKFGIRHHFTSLEEMLDTVDVDAVLVVTPIPHHFSQAMTAIEAGKHVYVQKTMTSTVDEADALLAARDEAGVRLSAAPGYDLFPLVGQMREVVRSGELGQVCIAYSYTLGFGHQQEPIRQGSGVLSEVDPSWYYRAGAGPLPDVTVYALQLLASLLGPVERISAMGNLQRPVREWRGKKIELDVEDNNALLLGFASGAFAVAVGSDCSGGHQVPWGGAALYGTHGALEITDVHHASGYPVAFRVSGAGEPREQAMSIDEQEYLQGEHISTEEPHVYADIMELVDAIRDERPTRATGEQARHVVEIVESARAAIADGATHRLRTTF
jgi:predicted dehydrogenase